MYKREGLPGEGDLVICTVTKIEHAVVFVELDEYRDVKGIIRIDEVAAGRIRSIRDYVDVGKKIVCKVLKVDVGTRTVDVSLRRVSEGLRKAKMDEFKKEQIAFKITEAFCKKHNISERDMYSKIINPILNKYELLYPFLQDVVTDNFELLKKEVKLNKKLLEEFYNVLKQKIPPRIYIRKGKLYIQTINPKGIEVIKEILKNIVERYSGRVHYVAAPDYLIEISSKDPKDLNKKVKEIQEWLQELENKKEDLYIEIEFER